MLQLSKDPIRADFCLENPAHGEAPPGDIILADDIPEDREAPPGDIRADGRPEDGEAAPGHPE